MCYIPHVITHLNIMHSYTKLYSLATTKPSWRQVSARQPCAYENLFMPSHRCWKPPSWGTPCDINALYASLESTFSELQYCRWQWSIFIRLAVIASETWEMSQNSKRIWPYSSSRSSKVIDLGVNGKPICDFLLVINCNFSRICYHFRDIHAWR